MVRLRIILSLHIGIHLIQRLIALLLLIDVLVREGDRHSRAGQVQQVVHGGVAVVLELVMADGGGGGDGRDDGVDLFAELLFELAPLREVLELVLPFLELDLPHVVQVGLGDAGVEQVLDVRDCGFAGGVDLFIDVLWLVSFLVCYGGGVEALRWFHRQRRSC